MRKIYLVALLMALVTGFSVYRFAVALQKNSYKEAPTTTVVVAAINISDNVKIEPTMLTVKKIAAADFPAGAAQEIEDVVGKVSPYPINTGEYVYISKLTVVGEKSKGGLSYQLPEGQRALTVKIDDVSGVGNYIKAGDFVDIISVHKSFVINPENNEKVETVVTEYIAQKIKVLKVGNISESDSNKQLYTSVTLSLTPEQVLTVNNHQINAILRLALRPSTDDEIVDVSPIIDQQN